MVGPLNKAKEFFIHRPLLTSNSLFFAAALDGQFEEGHTQTVNLPEEAPDSFAFFAQWLYTHDLTHEEVDIPHQGPVQGNEGPTKTRKPAYFKLLHLYALADRLSVEALGNQIVDKVMALAETTNSVPTPTDTWLLYENIRDGAPIRKLVVDLFAYMQTNKLLDTHEDDWHQRFLRDLVVKLRVKPKLESVHEHSWREGRLRCLPPFCYGCKKDVGKVNVCKTCPTRYCASCVAGDYRLTVDPYSTKAVIESWNKCDYHEHHNTERCSKK